MTNTTTMENERWLRLQEAQRQQEEVQLAQDKKNRKKTKEKLSFVQKIGKYWLFIVLAIFFDILAIIPFLSVIFNFIFGAILLFKFGAKKFSRIAWTIGVGSIFDFVFSILPVNITAVLIRIHSNDS